MSTISDIYTLYKVMPTLQMHMLRVAAVADIVCERAYVELPRRDIVAACLLHDMGNIIKFNLDKIPNGLDIGDVEYWKDVQRETLKLFGDDEHVATETIASEIGVSSEVMRILRGIGTSYAAHAFEGRDTPVLVATYADFRVTPTAVVSLEERIRDLLERYAGTEKYEPYKRTTEVYYSIEPYLMSQLGVDDVSFTNEEIERVVAEMRGFMVK
jgi:hypothetical protein